MTQRIEQRQRTITRALNQHMLTKKDGHVGHVVSACSCIPRLVQLPGAGKKVCSVEGAQAPHVLQDSAYVSGSGEGERRSQTGLASGLGPMARLTRQVEEEEKKRRSESESEQISPGTVPARSPTYLQSRAKNKKKKKKKPC
jgi:hypothetical protein